MRLSSLSLLACAAWLSACGRLGYELHELDSHDAGAVRTSPSAANASSTPPRIGAQAGRTAMDAGALSRDDATSTSTDSGAPARLARLVNAAACSRDEMCQSGACLDGVCCESRCDAPPQCYVADGATCSKGYCEYRAADNGTACNDANSCSKDDVCDHGSCSGRSECDDANSCTRDFCAPDRCAHASSCEPRGMPCTYAQRSGHGYWLCPGPVSFDAAHGECNRIGAKLVTIDDDLEQRALWQLGMRDTWIGYRSRADTENTDAGFDWVDGDSDFEDWAANRHTDQQDRDEDAGALDRCAYLAAAQEGAWRSHACGDSFAGFACELEQYAPPEAGCVYERRGGHGYFSCPEQRTWLDAAERCAASDAYLVELDDAEEQAFVASKLLRQGADVRYAIGATDAKDEGHFQTGRSQQLHFSAWADGEPSSASAENDFGVLRSQGADQATWQSVGPAERSYYICEQER